MTQKMLNKVYQRMLDLHAQGKSATQISVELEKEGVHAAAAAVEIQLGKKFGYCWTHYQIMTCEHKCPKC